MLKMLIATAGMLAMGWLAWSLLKRQGYASPPTDDEVTDADRSQ